MSDNKIYAVNIKVPKTTSSSEALFYCKIVKSAFNFPMELNNKFLKEFF